MLGNVLAVLEHFVYGFKQFSFVRAVRQNVFHRSGALPRRSHLSGNSACFRTIRVAEYRTLIELA